MQRGPGLAKPTAVVRCGAVRCGAVMCCGAGDAQNHLKRRNSVGMHTNRKLTHAHSPVPVPGRWVLLRSNCFPDVPSVELNTERRLLSSSGGNLRGPARSTQDNGAGGTHPLRFGAGAARATSDGDPLHDIIIPRAQPCDCNNHQRIVVTTLALTWDGVGEKSEKMTVRRRQWNECRSHCAHLPLVSFGLYSRCQVQPGAGNASPQCVSASAAVVRESRRGGGSGGTPTDLTQTDRCAR